MKINKITIIEQRNLHGLVAEVDGEDWWSVVVEWTNDAYTVDELIWCWTTLIGLFGGDILCGPFLCCGQLLIGVFFC